jgi:hypothetical protein
MKNTTIWLFGGISEENQVLNTLHRLSTRGLQPAWEKIALSNPPKQRFGASMNVVGNYVFLYGGFQTELEQEEDMLVLSTFEDPSMPPQWMRVFNMSKSPPSRFHFGSAAIGLSIYIHGGYHVPGQSSAGPVKREFWSLNTLPSGPPERASCPTGFRRAPNSADPCTDIGEDHSRRMFAAPDTNDHCNCYLSFADKGVFCR